MKVTLQKKQLNKALTTISKQNVGLSLPTVSFQVLFNEFSIWSKTRVSTTKFTYQVEESEPTEIITVGLKQLKEIVKNLEEEIFFDGNTFYSANITQHYTKLKNDHQEINIVSSDHTEIKLDTLEVINASKEALTVINKESPRNYGSASLFEFKDNCTKVVSTDGSRMNICDLNHDKKIDLSICIGYSGMELLARLDKKLSTTFQISQDETILTVLNGYQTFYIRLSNIKYPRYQSVLPITTNSLDIPTLAFKAALASALANNHQDKSKVITLKYVGSDILVSAGRFTEIVHDKTFYGEYSRPSFTLCANGSFILDTLKNSKEDSFNLRWNTNRLDEAFEIVPRDFCTNIIVPVWENK